MKADDPSTSGLAFRRRGTMTSHQEARGPFTGRIEELLDRLIKDPDRKSTAAPANHENDVAIADSVTFLEAYPLP